MNIATVVIGILILVLFVFAFRRSVKSKHCDGNCKNCSTSCNGQPDWVKRYREDQAKEKAAAQSSQTKGDNN